MLQYNVTTWQRDKLQPEWNLKLFNLVNREKRLLLIIIFIETEEGGNRRTIDWTETSL